MDPLLDPLHSLELTTQNTPYIRQPWKECMHAISLSWLFLITTALTVYLIPLLCWQCSFARYGAIKSSNCHRVSLRRARL